MTESIGKIQRPNVPQKLLIFVLAVVSVSPVGRTQNAKSEQVNKPNLQLSVRADRSSYSLKDKLHMEVQLTNVGNSDIYVWDWIFAGVKGRRLAFMPLTIKERWSSPYQDFL